MFRVGCTVAMIDRVRPAAGLLVLVALLHTGVDAQGTSSARGKGSAGVSLNFMSPQGEFRQNVSNGNWYDIGTLGFNLIAPLTPSGWLSLRIEYMFGIYEKSCRGCEFNSISLGPEVSVPRGPVRPYAMGEWGHLHFTSFNDASGEEADTGVGQWIYGGGVRIPLKASSGWSLDLGVRKHLGGTVSYVRTPGTRINGDLSVGVDPARTSTPFVQYGVGFQYEFK